MGDLTVPRLLPPQEPQAPQAPQEPAPAIQQALERMQQQRDELLRTSFNLATRFDPVRRAEAQRLAGELGLDPSLADRNLDDVRQLLARRQVERLQVAGQSPILLDMLQDPEFARIAHDKVTELSTAELVAGRWRAGIIEPELARLAAQARRGLPIDAQRFAALQQERARLPATSRGNLLAGAAYLLGQQTQTLPTALTHGVAAGTGLASLAALAGQAGPQAALPEEIATVPGAFAVGLEAGTLASTIAQSFEIESGLDYLDNLAAGYEPTLAASLSVATGAAKAILEGVGFGAVARPFLRPLLGQLRQQVAGAVLRPTVGQTARQFAQDYLLGVGGEVGTEALQTIVEDVGQHVGYLIAEHHDVLRPPPNWRQMLADVVATVQEVGTGMALLGLPGPALRAAHEMRQGSAHGRAVEDFGRFVDAMHATELPQRNPAAAQTYADAVAPQEVVIDGQRFAAVLNQHGTAREELQQAQPDLVRQVDQAAATGGDVVLSAGEFATRLPPSLAKALLPEVRLDPEARSATETAALAETIRQQAAEPAAEQGAAESAQRVEDAIQQQIAATGVVSPRDARASAQFYGAFVRVQAERLGVTPEQFAARFPLQVQAAEQPQEGVLHAPGRRGGFDPKNLVVLLYKQGADASTFLHESAHAYLSIYAEIAAQADAPALIRGDMQTLLASFGVPDLAAWRRLSLDQQRQHHEQFAAQFERYLAEGKAPSLELQGLFDRFLAWLARVYRGILGINESYRREFGQDLPALTPEVRAVMGRMLASEEQIAHAERVAGMVPLYRTQAEAGMTDEQWVAYQHLLQEARLASGTELTRSRLRQLGILQTAETRARQGLRQQQQQAREQVREQVTPAVRKQPVYRALAFLESGQVIDVDGTESGQAQGQYKLQRAAVHAVFPEGSAERRRLGRFTAVDGLLPDGLAPMFGFPSGEALLRAVAAAPRLDEAIAAQVEERLRAEHAELVEPQQVEAQVAQAIHSELRERVLGVELRHLTRAMQPVRLLVAAAREAARQQLLNMPLRTIRPHQHYVAEARASRQALQALQHGDTPAAADAKRRQLFQHELAKLARAANDEVAQALGRFQAVWQADPDLARYRNLDYVHGARALLSFFGLGRGTKMPLEHVEAIRQYAPEFYQEHLQPLLDRAMQGAKDYRQLTLGEFRLLRDSVLSLWWQSRREQVLRIHGQLVERERVKSELGLAMIDRGIPETVPGERREPTRGELRMAGLLNLRAALRRVESWARRMDGGKDGGPFTRYIFREVRQRLDDYRQDRAVYVRKLHDLVARLELPPGQVEAPELRYTFAGKHELLGALLHAGNQSNLRKLLLGRGWGEQLDDGGVDTSRWQAFLQRMIAQGRLTRADFDFAQAAWDLTEQLKPRAQEAHHELFGYYFDEVQPSELATPWGVYRGGYVPARTDPRIVPEAARQQSMEDLLADFRQAMPSTGRGFTMARVEYNRPLSLDVRLLVAHVDQVLRFVHVQPAVKDVLSLLRDRDVAGGLNRIDPTAINDMLVPWLNRAARQRVFERGKVKAVDAFWRLLRRNTAAALMFANSVNAVQQLTGISNASSMVPIGYLRDALVQYLGAPPSTVQQIAGWSQYMADRFDNEVHGLRDDLDELLLDTRWIARAQAWTTRHAYFLQQAMQNQVDAVTWLAAYNHHLAEHSAEASDAEAHAEAVAHADSVVRLTQGSSAPEDVAAYEVGTPWHRTWTMFSGYFNVILNQLLTAQPGAERAKVFLRSFAVPMLAAGAIASALYGDFDDGDDDGSWDEVAQWFFGTLARGGTSMLPAFGPALAAAAQAIATGNGRAGDRLALSPSISTAEASVRALRDLVGLASGDELRGRNIKDVLTLVAVATGIPVSALGRPLGYAVDVAQGRVEPGGTLDYLRGLLAGR